MKSMPVKWMLIASLLIVFSSCEKDRDARHSPVIEKEFTLTGFTKVYAMHGFNVTISKGAEFSIKAKGPSAYVNDMKLQIMSGQILDLQYQTNWNDPRVDVDITLPNLTQLNLAAAGNGTINGFEDETTVIRTILSGASKCTLNGAPINVQVDLSGASQVNVNGTTLSLYGSISGASKLNAYQLDADEVDIEASGASDAYVKALNSLFAAASGGSRIHYKGNPAQKHIETSGGGQVIQE